jgi:hypothetical protein
MIGTTRVAGRRATLPWTITSGPGPPSSTPLTGEVAGAGVGQSGPVSRLTHAPMTVLTCARYPVKSLGGEEPAQLHLDPAGAIGDRAWALRTAHGWVASGKRTRHYVRLPRLLEMSASTTPDGVVVTLPDGRRLAVDDPHLRAELAGVVGEPVSVATETDVPHRDDAPLHLVTTASLRWWSAQVPDERADWRRLRPNVVVAADGDERVEDEWVGRRLRIGDATVSVVDPTERCVMVSQDQCGLGRAPRLLRALARHQMMLGVYARVLVPGTVRTGDAVEVEV